VDPLAENIRRHDEVAARYDDLHSEIFNRTEQRRLTRALAEAWARIRVDHRHTLDFGAGTGNLTEKLLGLGGEVCAADVSSEMLRRLEAKHAEAVAAGRLRTACLDGRFPLPFPDGSFAFVAAYSVLHHVPDYLRAVDELARVVAVGGVLYVDHELNEEHWRSGFWVRVHRGLTLPGYTLGRLWARAARLWGRRDPALLPPGERPLTEEGDIHIHADDHIEWTRVQQTAEARGIADIRTEDYLLCREPVVPWRHWLCRGLATDVRRLVGVKGP
jgi:ubiquinone/menaquinone biosynthesis C-methylase UbiE